MKRLRTEYEHIAAEVKLLSGFSESSVNSLHRTMVTYIAICYINKHVINFKINHYFKTRPYDTFYEVITFSYEKKQNKVRL